MYSKIRMCVYVCTCAQAVCRVCLFVTLWTVARQAPLFDNFPGKNTGVGCQNRFLLFGVCVSVRAQLCPTVCDLMDSSPPVFSVYGISHTRILKWVCHFLLQGIFPTQGLNLHLLCLLALAGGFFTISWLRIKYRDFFIYRWNKLLCE